MKRLILSNLICIVVTVWAFSTASAQYNWRSLGPDNLGSKTRTLAFTANGQLLAGSEGGGLWASQDKGLSWQKVEGYTGNPNITSIAVDGNRIMVGTGAVSFSISPYAALLGSSYDFSAAPEGFIGSTGLPGAGVYVSTDNGASWSNANATTQAPFGAGTLNFQGAFASIQKITISNGRAFIATRSGLYYSDDPNLAWVLPATGARAEFIEETFFDVAVGADGRVFAGTADSVYISTDNGGTFNSIKDPSLFDQGRFSFQRTAIAVAPSDPNTIYIAGNRNNGELSGIWRSDDNGDSWRRYAQSGNPGFTPLGNSGRDAFTLAVFPDNADELIVAGNAWYTFTLENGWIQTAQHFVPAFDSYLPTNIYQVVFDPSDAQTLFIATEGPIARSTDGGESFSLKSKGYEAGLTYSAAGVVIDQQDAVLGSTASQGIIYNQLFNSNLPSQQGFNEVFPSNQGLVRGSYVYPGAIISQGNDQGLIRSFSFGETFEAFYGFPVIPGVRGLTDAAGDSLIDRSSPTIEGSGLLDNGGVIRTPFVIDESIPDAVLDAGKDVIQSVSDHFVFFCSKRFVWLVQNAIGSPDGLQPNWNRLTNILADGDEFLTAITVSGDDTHTVYVGTSKGNLFRITEAHDLANFDANTNVTQINGPGSNLPNGRSISALAVDPSNPARLAVAYGAYGGDVNGFPSFIWFTETVTTSPFFTPIPGALPKEPIYALAFAEDPATDEQVLLAGLESGLYSARNIVFGFAEWTTEFGPSRGNVPVYDIYVRRYKAEITNEETQDFRLIRDNTVFVATHGRGIWSTSDLTINQVVPDPIEEDLTNINQVSLFPNPSVGEPTLRVATEEGAELGWKLFGIDGREISSDNISFGRGAFQTTLPVENLSPGIYVLETELITEETRHTQTIKWVKQ